MQLIDKRMEPEYNSNFNSTPLYWTLKQLWTKNIFMTGSWSLANAFWTLLCISSTVASNYVFTYNICKLKKIIFCWLKNQEKIVHTKIKSIFVITEKTTIFVTLFTTYLKFYNVISLNVNNGINILF